MHRHRRKLVNHFGSLACAAGSARRWGSSTLFYYCWGAHLHFRVSLFVCMIIHMPKWTCVFHVVVAINTMFSSRATAHNRPWHSHFPFFHEHSTFLLLNPSDGLYKRVASLKAKSVRLVDRYWLTVLNSVSVTCCPLALLNVPSVKFNIPALAPWNVFFDRVKSVAVSLSAFLWSCWSESNQFARFYSLNHCQSSCHHCPPWSRYSAEGTFINIWIA